jgi:hypothetical protein
VSIATQRQALTALVFLFREALGRDLGDLSGYEVSRRGARVPTVLSRVQCQRLFEKLEGTNVADEPAGVGHPCAGNSVQPGGSIHLVCRRRRTHGKPW